jgi:hypothetical protein
MARICFKNYQYNLINICQRKYTKKKLLLRLAIESQKNFLLETKTKTWKVLTYFSPHFFSRETLPGRFYELNIHFGLFVGGQGDFSELFLGHQDNLRGCMADVNYNGVNVLARARERIGAVDVHGVTWSCAEEFDVGPERDVSFVEDGAFIALPNAISRTGAK